MAYRMLLADDSLTIQKVVELTFSDSDCELRAVGNGEKAVQALHDFDPDIVLADAVMPGLTGYEVCEAVKRLPNGATIPVMLLTGTFEPFDRARAERVGCDAIVTKPFDSNALVSQVKELLEKARAARDAAPTLPAFDSTEAPSFDSSFEAEYPDVDRPDALYATTALRIPTPAELEEIALSYGQRSQPFGGPEPEQIFEPARADSLFENSGATPRLESLVYETPTPPPPFESPVAAAPSVEDIFAAPPEPAPIAEPMPEPSDAEPTSFADATEGLGFDDAPPSLPAPTETVFEVPLEAAFDAPASTDAAADVTDIAGDTPEPVTLDAPMESILPPEPDAGPATEPIERPAAGFGFLAPPAPMSGVDALFPEELAVSALADVDAEPVIEAAATNEESFDATIPSGNAFEGLTPAGTEPPPSLADMPLAASLDEPADQVLAEDAPARTLEEAEPAVEEAAAPASVDEPAFEAPSFEAPAFEPEETPAFQEDSVPFGVAASLAVAETSAFEDAPEAAAPFADAPFAAEAAVPEPPPFDVAAKPIGEAEPASIGEPEEPAFGEAAADVPELGAGSGEPFQGDIEEAIAAYERAKDPSSPSASAPAAAAAVAAEDEPEVESSDLEALAAQARLSDLKHLIPGAAAASGAETGAASGSLSAQQIDAIARRVIEILGERVVREIAWEVVPELAERLVRARLAEIENG